MAVIEFRSSLCVICGTLRLCAKPEFNTVGIESQVSRKDAKDPQRTQRRESGNAGIK
jgi:hypothetical protein